MEKLTKQEEDVMQHIWKLGGCTVKEMVGQMDEPRPPYTTVASVAQNLKRKGYVSQHPRGNTYVYEPLIGQSEYKRQFMAGFVRDYFRGSFREMVSFFAKEQELSSEDLQDIIDEIESGSTK